MSLNASCSAFVCETIWLKSGPLFGVTAVVDQLCTLKVTNDRIIPGWPKWNTRQALSVNSSQPSYRAQIRIVMTLPSFKNNQMLLKLAER